MTASSGRQTLRSPSWAWGPVDSPSKDVSKWTRMTLFPTSPAGKASLLHHVDHCGTAVAFNPDVRIHANSLVRHCFPVGWWIFRERVWRLPCHLQLAVRASHPIERCGVIIAILSQSLQGCLLFSELVLPRSHHLLPSFLNSVHLGQNLRMAVRLDGLPQDVVVLLEEDKLVHKSQGFQRRLCQGPLPANVVPECWSVRPPDRSSAPSRPPGHRPWSSPGPPWCPRHNSGLAIWTHTGEWVQGWCWCPQHHSWTLGRASTARGKASRPAAGKQSGEMPHNWAAGQTSPTSLSYWNSSQIPSSPHAWEQSRWWPDLTAALRQWISQLWNSIRSSWRRPQKNPQSLSKQSGGASPWV